MKTIGVVLAVAGGATLLALAAPQFSGKPDPGQKARRNRIRMAQQFGYKNVVRGRVTDAQGRPVVGVRVVARFRMHQTGMTGEGDAVTGDDGRYVIEALGTNDFMVGVGVENTPFLTPAPQPANLRTVVSLTRDFVLEDAPKVTVKVIDAEDGSPIEGLSVTAERFSGGPPTGKTDAKGTFVWYPHSLDFTISLGNSADDWGRERFGAAPDYAFYKEFKLTDAKPFVWETKAYRNPFQPKDVDFRGVVVDEQGNPVPDARVQLLQYSERRSATTDAKGRFEVSGRRVLNFGDNHQDDIVLFADKDDLSATVRPTPEETWGELKVVVQRDGVAQIMGRIVDEKSRPVVGVQVSCSEYFVGGSGGGTGTVYTDDAGRFVLDGLRPTGHYIAHFSGQGWGSTQIPRDWRQGEHLEFRAGEKRDLGTVILPHANAPVAGVLIGKDGKPLKGKTTLTLKGEHFDQTVSPDDAGRFRFEKTVDEPLTLRVFASDGSFTRTGDDSPDRLLTQKVRSGETNLRLVARWRAPQP